MRVEGNDLSCSAAVKAEIVLPILEGEKVLGELDIDSHDPAPFDEEDRRFLQAVVALTRLLPPAGDERRWRRGLAALGEIDPAQNQQRAQQQRRAGPLSEQQGGG